MFLFGRLKPNSSERKFHIGLKMIAGFTFASDADVESLRLSFVLMNLRTGPDCCSNVFPHSIPILEPLNVSPEKVIRRLRTDFTYMPSSLPPICLSHSFYEHVSICCLSFILHHVAPSFFAHSTNSISAVWPFNPPSVWPPSLPSLALFLIRM